MCTSLNRQRDEKIHFTGPAATCARSNLFCRYQRATPVLCNGCMEEIKRYLLTGVF